MAKPFKNPVNGILPGFQVPGAVQLTFSKRYRVVVMYASLVCFLSQHLNLLQRFLHICTYFHYIPHAYTISAYIFAGLAILSAYCMANPFKNVVAYLDCFLKCTVNHSKPVESLLHGFSPLYRLYHMPRPTQLTFLKASNTVSLLYGKTLQEPS